MPLYEWKHASAERAYVLQAHLWRCGFIKVKGGRRLAS
jgi:hypothetical protein